MAYLRPLPFAVYQCEKYISVPLHSMLFNAF